MTHNYFSFAADAQGFFVLYDPFNILRKLLGELVSVYLWKRLSKGLSCTSPEYRIQGLPAKEKQSELFGTSWLTRLLLILVCVCLQVTVINPQGSGVWKPLQQRSDHLWETQRSCPSVTNVDLGLCKYFIISPSLNRTLTVTPMSKMCGRCVSCWRKQNLMIYRSFKLYLYLKIIWRQQIKFWNWKCWF